MAGRYALIVATDEYEDARLRRLRAPARDAEALAGVLRDPEIGGFDVQLLSNESDGALRRRIAEFFSDRARDDLLLLHFSCHGLKDDSGQLFFAARDTEVAQLDASAIAAEFVSRQMARSRSNSVLMLLDCCYSGAIARGLTFRAGDTVDVEDHLGGHGRAIITASSAMEYAFEGDELSGHGRPSVFTSAVVKALETGEADRDQDHWISVRELYDYVCDEVRELTPHQRPNLLSHLEGELYIARSSYVAPEGARAASPPTPAPAATPAPAPRTGLWPVVACAVGGAAMLLGWFLPWQYGASLPDLLSSTDVTAGERIALIAPLPTGLLGLAVAAAIPSAVTARRVRLACLALLLLAGLALGATLAAIARWTGPLAPGPPLTLACGIALVAAMLAALRGVPPAGDRAPPWREEGVAAGAALLTAALLFAGPMRNYGTLAAVNGTITAIAVAVAAAGAAVAARDLLARTPGRRTLAVAAAGAVAVGTAVPAADWAALAAALVMTAAAVRAAPVSGATRRPGRVDPAGGRL